MKLRIVAIATVVATSVLATQPVDAGQCATMTSIVGEPHREQEKALYLAQQAWSRAVGINEGGRYADWSKARQKRMSCWQNDGADFVCKIRGLPCQS